MVMSPGFNDVHQARERFVMKKSYSIEVRLLLAGFVCKECADLFEI